MKQTLVSPSGQLWRVHRDKYGAITRLTAKDGPTVVVTGRDIVRLIQVHGYQLQ